MAARAVIVWDQQRPGVHVADAAGVRWEAWRVNIVRGGRRLKSTVWSLFRDGAYVKDFAYLCDAQRFVDAESRVSR